MNSIADIWSNILERMKGELSETTINTWFDDVSAVGLEKDVFILHCPSDFKRSNIEQRFLGNIQAALRDFPPPLKCGFWATKTTIPTARASWQNPHP